MVAIGERSGQLEDMLMNVADTYDVAGGRAHRRAHLLLEPVMIVVMGGGVAFIVASRF